MATTAAAAVAGQLACLNLGASAAVGSNHGVKFSSATAVARLAPIPAKLDSYSSASPASALSFAASVGSSKRLALPKSGGSARFVCEAMDGASDGEEDVRVVDKHSQMVPEEDQVEGFFYYEDGSSEREEDIEADYARLYGAAVAKKVEVDFGDDEDDDSKGSSKRRGRRGEEERGGKRAIKDNFEERVLQIRRVTKVVKGGKQLSFRAIVVVGDKRGTVGVGVGKAKEIVAAVQKAAKDARRHAIKVPMTKYLTFPHRADGHYGAARVMLRPAAPGSGIVAGGAVRVVLDLSGVENALGKQVGGSTNPLNNARATLEGISQMRQFRDVAAMRGVTMEYLWS